MPYIWEIVEEEERKEIFTSLSELTNNPAFPPDMTKIEKRRPRFFKHAYHYKITGANGKDIKFTGYDNNYFFLDGSPKAIYEVNAREKLILSKDHVIAYLAYFLRNVQGQYGDMDIVINKERSSFITQVSRDERERILEREHGIKVKFDDFDNFYSAAGTLYYNDEFIDAVFRITQSGKVTIKTNGFPIKMKG